MKELPKENVKPDDDGTNAWIQFRGAQSRVMVEGYGILFTTEGEGANRRHKPLPVVERDAENPPQNAVVQDLAEELVDTNENVCWGIACEHEGDDVGGEVCGEVFATPKALDGHQSQHSDTDAADGRVDATSGTEETDTSTGTSENEAAETGADAAVSDGGGDGGDGEESEATDEGEGGANSDGGS